MASDSSQHDKQVECKVGSESSQATIGIYGYCQRFGDTFGGVESHIFHLARQLKNSGYRVVVHCNASQVSGWHVQGSEISLGTSSQEVEPGIFEFLPRNGPGLEGASAENVATSEKFGEKLILAFGTRDGFVFELAIRAATELNVPLVSFVFFTIEERWYRAQFTSRTRSIPGIADESERARLLAEGESVLRRLAEHSALMVAPTHFVRGELTAMLNPAAAASVVVNYHGVDASAFPPRREPWGGSLPMMLVSRLSTPFAGSKNFFWACSALRDLHRAGCKPSLSIFGAGNAAPMIEDFARNSGLESHLHVRGFSNQRDLAKCYRTSSLLLVPSMMEAGCTVIVEAVLSGCLPVALDFAGSAELMDRLGLSELLLPAELTELGEGVQSIIPRWECSQAIITRSLADSERANMLLSRAYELAQHHFTIEVTTDKLLKLMNQRGLL